MATKTKKTKFPTPKLIPLDMKLSKEHNHPDINEKDTYLCLIDGQYFTGQFSKVWFGWNFDGWHNCLQFDAPGWNASGWQQIWKMVSPKKPKKVVIKEPCPHKGCKGTLKSLKTCYGDPEGIRSDSKCRKCGRIYGCSKSSRFELSEEHYEDRKAMGW